MTTHNTKTNPYAEYDAHFDYEGDGHIREYLPFFPSNANDAEQVLCFLVNYFMQTQCDLNTGILHNSKTYRFLISCYSYQLNRCELSERQADAVLAAYQQYRKEAVTEALKNMKKFEQNTEDTIVRYTPSMPPEDVREILKQVRRTL